MVLKTVRIDFGEELTNHFLFTGLPNGALDFMTVPFVYNKKIQNGESPFKTFKISEINVVWKPVLFGSDRPIKRAKKKSAKEDQGLENLKRMLNEMLRIRHYW